jgi:hypothetical protein
MRRGVGSSKDETPAPATNEEVDELTKEYLTWASPRGK